MDTTTHLHAKQHHRAECTCKDCSFRGCSEDNPCLSCDVVQLLSDYRRLRGGESEHNAIWRDELVSRIMKRLP